MELPNLKRERKLLGLSQMEVAVKLGVSVNAYRLWEYGGNKPNYDNYVKLKSLFNLD